MSQASLQLVFLTIAFAKLLYAAPAWWGFANFGDVNRLEAFFCEEPTNQAITLGISQ